MQLVEYLVSFPGVDVNVLNDEGMTALDIASAAAKEKSNCAMITLDEGMTALDIAFAAAKEKSDCAMIVKILEDAGAVRSSLIPKYNTSDLSNDSKQEGDKDIVNTHMVVASLIATITFAAIFQIPGGIEDDENSIHYEAAKMAFRRIFRFFIFSDTAAFSTSLTVVAAWIIRQLIGDAHFQGRSALSPLSGITLLVSIFWTVAAFVSATIIVVLPPHHEKLRSKDKEDFYKYQVLLAVQLFLGIIPPIGVGIFLVLSIYRFPYARFSFKRVLPYVSILLFVFMCVIIDNTFELTGLYKKKK